jgi:hypothetical protein
MWTKKKAELPPEVYPSVIEGIKRIYEQRLKPLELAYKFDEFHSPIMRGSDFEAKPSVLFLGQYSTGKVSVPAATAVEDIFPSFEKAKTDGEKFSPSPSRAHRHHSSGICWRGRIPEHTLGRSRRRIGLLRSCTGRTT